MPLENWRDAVARMQQDMGLATDRQKDLARIANIELTDSLPRLVAGALLQNALWTELGLPEPGAATGIQQEIIMGLITEGDTDPKPADRREADAWIEFFRLKARCRALADLKIEAGDIVRIENSAGERLGEVSSIGNDGRIYFKGGLGGRAWPDVVTVAARTSETTAGADDLRRKAANDVASRTRTSDWSAAKHTELEEFEVTTVLTSDDIGEFEEVIGPAHDERPIQAFIETRPQLLTSLLGGNLRYLLPRRRLGSEYITDFVIGDVDSLGIRWVLVELETPASSVTLQSSHELDQHARKGVSQIKEWREWLQQNLDYASRSKQRQGLGLLDMRAGSEGLVLVGRRARLHSNSGVVRHSYREQNNIGIHTYDWLLDRLRGLLTFSGPPAANPHLIQPRREKSKLDIL